MSARLRTAYSVAFLPFWRFAVAIDERPDLPAIPFYRLAAAEVFHDDLRERFPERTITILRRTFRGTVEVVNAKP